SPQGMAAETSSAAIILTSAHFGMALSTTHVATGSILGSGVGRPGADVRWGVAGRMAIAWVTTIPIAALVSFGIWIISDAVTSATSMAGGALAAFAILIAVVTAIIIKARKQPVHADNVNADWDEHGLAPEAAHSDSAVEFAGESARLTTEVADTAESAGSADVVTEVADTAGLALSGAPTGVHDPAHFVDTTDAAADHRKDL
ncbi:MAG: inorganic phosphate transporter, partial [Corynebacterium sp.]